MLKRCKKKQTNKTKQFFSMFESRFCNVLSRQLVKTSLQTLFSPVKITLDCYSINHLGNETFKFSTKSCEVYVKYSEEMKLHSNEHFAENFKLSLFKSFIFEVVYVWRVKFVGSLFDFFFVRGKNVQRVPR